ncbi:MAG: Gfo/Idh/MocA family oxidoreductase [Candidatus Hydrogenedens sp.]|nr:Gfo/Idh/MocA family oxidoreductase [Candidatus Hydrogenedentota bacterium]NLF59170.1 Gfo/Idh/MocA family oxidoreductase [Candidatus Hydrogenedens sp.]
MKSPLRVGFVSFAHGHVTAYAQVMRDFDDVRLVAAWDANPERGRSVCEPLGMEYRPELAAVLDDPEIDAVIIGSETVHHEAHVLAAAAAGKHVLLQKPMALSLDSADRIAAAVNAAGIRFAMAFQMRHDPANQRIREIVRSGVLGDIAVARRRHCIGVCLAPEFINSPANWHLSAEMNRGMFADDAAHPADWFHWIFGRPVSVMAEIGNVITDCAPDDNGVAVYRFPSGMMGILFNSSTVMAGENTTEIYGAKGCLIQNYGDGPSCSVPRRPDGPALKWFIYGESDWHVEEIPIPPDQGHRIRAVPRPWVDAMLNDAPLPATAEDGRTALEMVLGAYKSAEEGRRVTFPL